MLFYTKSPFSKNQGAKFAALVMNFLPLRHR
jgi:hypothetical protein